MKPRQMADALRAEMRRRWRDRNAPGYWGVNARAWIRHHIRFVCAGCPDGFTQANQQVLT